MRELPSGTVTFLFTDLEGSTRLWEASPALMEHAVRRHDEIMARAIAAHAGVLFKHTGDGICAAFDSPVNAIAAAVTAQQDLASEPWPEELDRPLRARMGVHTGTARAQAGDYLGPALNRVARLMSAGHGGQILISAASERLARDGMPPGAGLLDLGAHRLRDLTTPEQVFQVTHPSLPDRFDPLRTIDSMPGNLPLQVTSFIGRERHMHELATALSESRLVTLTGVGGVGKTRLALQVASEVLVRFIDGAWFVELAPVGEPDAVPHALARVLGAQEMPNRTITDTVVEVLRPRRCLLILDNCEHLLHAAGSLAERIVRACPYVTIIATSREPLAVEGEHVWPVTSLAIPARDMEPEVEDLRTISSVELFVDRARAARPDFALTADNAAPVAEICRRLDGVPLALELAAARVRSMAPSEIAHRLDERFRLLRGGRRTAMERHQTLRATVEWSYGLLTDDERNLFDRLSVFAGGFILEAVEATCSGDPIDDFDVPDLVTSLAEKSMLVVEDQPDGVTRFLMLETIRQFGEERLVERAEAPSIGRAHAHYFAALAAKGFEGIRGRDEARWVQVLQQEFDNVRAAHTWGMTNEDPTIALGIAADMHPFAAWRAQGEPYSWARAAIAIPGAETDPRYPHACVAIAWDGQMTGEIDVAETMASRAIERLDRPDAWLAQAWFGAGARGWSEGAEVGLSSFERGRDVAREAGASAELAIGEACIALLHAYRGDPEAAIPHVDAALAAAEHSQNPSTQAQVLYAVGEVFQDVDPGRAAPALEAAIAKARTVHARFSIGIALVSLASVRARHGDPREAAAHLLEAVEEWRRRGNWRQQWVTLANVAELFARMRLDDEAAVMLAAITSSTHGSTLWGAQAERLSALRDGLQESMGERCREATERGARMNNDEAVEYARAALKRACAAVEPLRT